MTHPPGQDPRILTLGHPSSILDRKRKRCFAVLPREEDHPGPLPICYFLHAWGGTAEAFLNHPEIRPLLLAAPQVSVFPESFRRWFINDHEGKRYEDYFVGEMMPAVEASLGERADPGRRAVVGFSMGGAAAFLLAARHRGLFRAAACHAGAFDAHLREGDPYLHLRNGGPLLMPTEAEHDAVWGPPGSETRRRYDPYRHIGDVAAASPSLALYLDVGSEDFPRMLEMNRSFHQALEAAGVHHHYLERPGMHDMDFVAAGLPSSLAFVLAAAGGEGPGESQSP